MTAIMGTMSEPVRGKSAVGFPSALLAFLSFEGCLSFGLASPPPGWSSGFVSRSLRPSNAVLRSVAALETRPFCSLLNVVLFHSERACSYASVRDATVSSVYLPNSASLAYAAAIGASSALLSSSVGSSYMA